MAHFLVQQGRIWKHVFADRVTFVECLAAVRANLGSQAPLVLCDFTGATDVQLDAGQIRELVREIAQGQRPPNAKTAIAAPKDLIFGMARMVEAYAEIEEVKHAIRAFRDVGAALEWLSAGGPVKGDSAGLQRA